MRPTDRLHYSSVGGDVLDAPFPRNITLRPRLLIHRKRSPFPDKGRLGSFALCGERVRTVFYLQTINSRFDISRLTTSLPLSGKVAFAANKMFAANDG